MELQVSWEKQINSPFCCSYKTLRGPLGPLGWDDWMAPPTQWTWVWVNSGSWWWTGKLGVLHHGVTKSWTLSWVGVIELNWTEEDFWASPMAQQWRIYLQCRHCRRHRFDPWVRKIPWSNPLQYSCLENPIDRKAWCTTVHGIAKSHTHWINLACKKISGENEA